MMLLLIEEINVTCVSIKFKLEIISLNYTILLVFVLSEGKNILFWCCSEYF